MIMKKLINKPEDITRELFAGMVKSNADLYEFAAPDIIVRKNPKDKGKVWIVFGQGAGHEPGYSGVLGYGMHDVEVPGGIFACSGGDRIYEGIKLAWERSGHTPVLLLIANHEGDVLNAGMALDLARDDGIDVQSVLLYDDIASAPRGREKERRGMAGMTFSFKIAGALAEEGADRARIIETIEKLTAQTRTLAVAVRPCTIPTTGQPLFDLEDDELLIGPGAHGEPGPDGPLKMMSADEVMDQVARRILEDGEFKSGDDVLVLVNGCGATTLMEMFILYNRLDEILKDRNLSPYKPLIGNYVTTQEMAGFSLSMAPADDEIKRLWSQPANTPFFKVMG